MEQHTFGSTQPGYARAFFDGRGDITPSSGFKLLQKDYHHDIALVDVYGARVDSSIYRTGAPVTVEYGTSGRNIGTFYGYVNHLEPMLDSKDRNRKVVTRVVCVGASWVMKKPIQQSFVGRTASSIIRQIAESNRFTTDVDESDVVWESLASPGQTEWEFLVMLAKRMGFSLACTNTEVRCVEQLAQLQRRGGAVAIFVGPNATRSATNIDTFEAVSGETTPDGGDRTVRLGFGINPRTGALITARNDMSELDKHQLGRSSTTPIFERVMKDLVLTDQLNARERLSSEARSNRFHIQAKATVIGDTKVAQGTVILVTGVDDRNSGYWYVHEVEHCIDSRHYEMHLVLGRDSIGAIGDEEVVSGRRVLRERFDPFDIRVQAPPPTLLINDVWRSAYAAKKQAV